MVIASRGLDREKELYRITLESILNQTLKPKAIYFCTYESSGLKERVSDVTYVLADGIDSFTGFSGYKPQNMGFEKALADDCHIAVSGDDCYFPPDYFEKLMSHLQLDNIGIIGGLRWEKGKIELEHTIIPSGAGRLYNKDLVRYFFPLKYTNTEETLQLYKTEMLGYKLVVDKSTYFKHLRPSKSWSIRSSGQCAYQLEYPLIQSILRIVVWLMTERKLKLSMLLGHVEAMLTPKKFPKPDKQILKHIHYSLNLRYKMLFMRLLKI